MVNNMQFLQQKQTKMQPSGKVDTVNANKRISQNKVRICLYILK